MEISSNVQLMYIRKHIAQFNEVNILKIYNMVNEIVNHEIDLVKKQNKTNNDIVKVKRTSLPITTTSISTSKVINHKITTKKLPITTVSKNCTKIKKPIKCDTKMIKDEQTNILKLDIPERHNNIYLLYPTNNAIMGQKIYKYGRTYDCLERFRGYQKNSTLLFFCRVKDCYHVETEILNLFKKHFTRKHDIGREYFEGDPKLMINYINQIIDHMDQRLDNTMLDEIKNVYATHLKFAIYDYNKIPDNLSDILLDNYKNMELCVKKERQQHHVPRTKDADKVPIIFSKTYIDKIIKTVTPTFNENNMLCEKSDDLSENDKLSMAKYQLKTKLHLINTTPEDIINSCITEYCKNESIIDAILYCNKKNVNDGSLVPTKLLHFKSAYDKTVSVLDCRYFTGTKTFDADDFNERFKNIIYTDVELLSLNSQVQMKDKYRIIKAIFARYGISLTSESIRVYKNKKQVRVMNYVLHHDKEVYAIIRNIVINNEDQYTDNFMEIVRTYDKYQEYLPKQT